MTDLLFSEMFFKVQNGGSTTCPYNILWKNDWGDTWCRTEDPRLKQKIRGETQTNLENLTAYFKVLRKDLVFIDGKPTKIVYEQRNYKSGQKILMQMKLAQNREQI